MQRLARIACALVATLLMQLVAVPAFAQTPEELAAARRLFVEGKELEAEKKWSEALAKFEKVASVKITPQVRFHLALCHEHLGRLVEAINGFEIAEQEARAAGAKAQDVLENAPTRAAALRERVAKLTLTVEGTVYTSKIFLDGKEVAGGLIDTSIPVDPGDHVVEVKRDGEVTFSQEVIVEEGETHELELSINDPKPPPTPDPDPDKPDPDPDNGGTVTSGGSDLPPQWIAYIVAGVGGAALITSGVLWGLRQSKLDSVAASCDDPDNFTGCDPDTEAAAQNAETLDITSKVLVAVGITTVAAGVGLWFLLWDDDDPQPTTGTKARVHVVPTPGGLVVTGAF